MKEECSDPLTKGVSASVPSNSVTESVADPVILATRVDSLSLSTERDGFAKPKLWAPTPSQRLLKLKSASSWVTSISVTEPVANPAMMAIRVDNLSWAAELWGFDGRMRGIEVGSAAFDTNANGSRLAVATPNCVLHAHELLAP